MPASNRVMIHKLQNAINQRGYKLLYEKSQFYSDNEDRPITMYRISRAVRKENEKRHRKEKLFESPSMIQIVLYLRDFWYTISGQEIPTDNEAWEKVKETKAIQYDWIKNAAQKEGEE